MQPIFRTIQNVTQDWTNVEKSKKGVRDIKKRSLRILSLIVAIVMAISILPLAALADTIDKGTGRVGLVVYGAELTQIVSQKNSLDSILDLAGDAIAEGVTVPKVKVELTNVETNQKYYL